MRFIKNALSPESDSVLWLVLPLVCLDEVVGLLLQDGHLLELVDFSVRGLEVQKSLEKKQF